MQLGVTNQMKQMHKNALVKATDMKDQLVGHSIIPDMFNDIISWFAQLPGRSMQQINTLVSNVTATLGGLGSKAFGWASDMMN